ncbi:MAG: hypothetical protein WBA88_18075, partial [Pseudaminobacter sp.]
HKDLTRIFSWLGSSDSNGHSCADVTIFAPTGSAKTDNLLKYKGSTLRDSAYPGYVMQPGAAGHRPRFNG